MTTRARRWAATVAAVMATAGLLGAGSEAGASAATGSTGTTLPAPVAAGPVADLPLPPVPGPPLPGTMRSRGERAMERFDGKSREAPEKVAAWGVDAATGKLRVDVVGERSGATDRFTADPDPAAVEVVTGASPVRPYADLVGGQAIFGSGSRCSLGFSVTRGSTVLIVTAGHCTEGGGTWSGFDGEPIGPVSGSNYPRDDFGAITRTNTAAWTPTARVEGGPTVRGSTVAGVGAEVCRSGSTTGYRCGVVQGFDQTVNYGGGNVVQGLTRTDACAEPGDSGGPFVTPAGQAQGLTSGGSGDCTVGGTTFFQPIGEVLQRYRVRLVTG